LPLIGAPAEVLDQAQAVRAIGVKLPDVTEVAYQLRKAGRWEGALPVDDLRFRYDGGQEALKGVSLSVRRGEFIALMSPNGAGKTTLAKHFNGLLKPSAGRVVVGGADTRENTVAQLAARVGYVFQNPDHQIFSETIAEELAFGPKNLGRPQDKIDAAVERVLADLGLNEQRQAEPFFIGLAERKLIAIGSVLIMGPESWCSTSRPRAPTTAWRCASCATIVTCTNTV
jgi:energy-coupling factor transport system ATP-binding protein